MSLSEKLRGLQKQREEKEAKQRELVALRASMIFAKEEAKRKAIAEEEERRQKLLDDKRFQEEERRRIEEEKKTRHYFVYDKYERKVKPPGEPFYYGEHTGKETTKRKPLVSIPHGMGQLYLNDTVKVEGHFIKGMLHGNGELHYDNGWTYTGEFKSGLRHGVGIMSKVGEAERHVITRQNEVICYRDELVNGIQIELLDKLFESFPKYTQKLRATVIKQISGWTFRIRFHEDLQPQERDMDLSVMKRVTVLKHLPLIYNLSIFDIGVEHRTIPYDYQGDNFVGGVANLRIAGSRRGYDMKPVNARPLSASDRTKSNHRENWFEPRALGIGAALEEELEEQRRELQKKQFEELIAKRRLEEERERQKKIEEEQKRQMQEEIDRKKKENEAKRKERADHEEALKKRIAEEAAVWDNKKPDTFKS